MKKKRKRPVVRQELPANTGAVWYPHDQTVHKVYPDEQTEGLGHIYIDGIERMVVVNDKLLNMYELVPVKKFVGDEGSVKTFVRYKGRREML